MQSAQNASKAVIQNNAKEQVSSTNDSTRDVSSKPASVTVVEESSEESRDVSSDSGSSSRSSSSSRQRRVKNAKSKGCGVGTWVAMLQSESSRPIEIGSMMQNGAASWLELVARYAAMIA